MTQAFAIPAKNRSRVRAGFEQNQSHASELLLLIVASTFLRVIFAATTDLGVDEAYTVATARHLALSTYDHPPMAWWIVAAAHKISSSESALLLRLPFIGLAAISTFLVFRLTRELFDERPAWFAVLLFSASPVLSVTSGTWILPDGPLIASMLACVLALSKALLSPQARYWHWLSAGAWGGIALLSKYHAIFLFIGTFLFIALTPSHRRWLSSPWPYVAALISAILFSPVIIWNAEHHWVSLAFQSSRATVRHIRIWMPLVAMAGQALFLLPTVWWACARSVADFIKRSTEDLQSWFLLYVACGPIIVVTISSAWSTSTLFHWAAPGYLFLLPMAGRYLAREADAEAPRPPHWLTASLAFVAVLTLLVSTVSIIALPWHDWRMTDPLRDMRTWRGLGAALRDRNWLNDDVTFVAGTRWHVAGRLDYALGGHVPVTCLCSDARGYGVLAPISEFAGRSAVVLIIGKDPTREAKAISSSFSSFEPLGDLELKPGDEPIVTFHAYRGVNFSGGLGAP